MMKFVSTKLVNGTPYDFNLNRLLAFYPYEVNEYPNGTQGCVLHLNDNRTVVVQMSYERLQELIGADNYAS